MPIFRISDAHLFPNPELADPSGLLGVGGDLSPARLVLAYRMGIFPWYNQGQPYLWWSPDPRTVLFHDELHVSRSLAKRIRRGDYDVTFDQAFEQVIEACATVPREGQAGTWITDEMVAAYVYLHKLGIAHSCESWRDGELVGGLYGVAIGKLYCGESMFARASDASKVAYVTMVRHLQAWGYPLSDCQVHTDHLARFGARQIPREEYLALTEALVDLPVDPGAWQRDPTL